jgi:hypothetical protein
MARISKESPLLLQNLYRSQSIDEAINGAKMFRRESTWYGAAL